MDYMAQKMDEQIEAGVSENERLWARIEELEAWIKDASLLIRAVGLDPIPERRKAALKLWESIPVNPFT